MFYPPVIKHHYKSLFPYSIYVRQAPQDHWTTVLFRILNRLPPFLKSLIVYVVMHAARQLDWYVGFLQCNLRNCSKDLQGLSYIYNQFVLAALEYATYHSLDSYHLCNINKIEMIQHRTATFMLGCPWRRDIRDSITPLLHHLPNG